MIVRFVRLGAFLVFAVSVVACKTVPMPTFEPLPVASDSGSTRAAILAGIKDARYGKYRWKVEDEIEGQVDAAFDTRKHLAAVRITYDDQLVKLQYLRSANLSCEPQGATCTRIHSAYGKWVGSLWSMVASRLANPPRDIPITPRDLSPISQYKLDLRVKGLADQLGSGMRDYGVSRIAVLPFGDAAGPGYTPLGNYLTDKVTYAFYQAGVVKVIERSALDKVMREQELVASPRFDDESVQVIGKLLGVDAVVIGTFAELHVAIVEVHARSVSVSTGEIIGVAKTEIPKANIDDLLR